MTRFFIRPEQKQGELVSLDAADAHHLRVVLKAKIGDPIAVLDGSGAEWPGILEQLHKTSALVRLGEPFLPRTEPKTRITIAQALPKMAEKMEHVLQHGTEIGAAAFWVFQSTRSQTHLSGERQTKRMARWEAIIKTAAEQAHRAVLPEISAHLSFRDILPLAKNFDLALLADASVPHDSLRDVLERLPTPPQSVLALIGPESGFTETEIGEAGKAGLTVVSLGPRILRTETAAFVLLAQMIYASG